jgi:putative transposase
MWLSIAEILSHVAAGAPGLPRSRRTLAQLLASVESKPRYERGGGLEYALSGLPPAFQKWVAPADSVIGAAITITPAAYAEAVDSLLATFGEWWEASKLSRTQAVSEFCRAVRSNTVQLAANIKACIKSLSISKLWALLSGKRRFGRHGTRNRMGAIDKDPDLQAFCLGLINQSAANIHRKLILHFPHKSIPCAKTIERWINRFAADNPAIYAGATNPIEYRNSFAVRAGNLSEGITHANQLWEIDGTKSNNFSIKGADGKEERYTLLVAIDVYSRRAITVVAKSESSESIIELLLRKCLITWGLPESIKVDNGKGFVSNRTRATCASLAIKLNILPPGTPELKPHVERFHRTLDMMLLSTLPGYVGNSVEARKVLEARAGDKGIQGVLTAQEIGQAIDNWTNNYYEAKHLHRGIDKTPMEQWATSPIPARKLDNLRALDMLLMPIGKRNPTVQGTGITYENRPYTDANGDWVTMIGKKISIRLNPLEPLQIYCFDPRTNAFLFVALSPEGDERAKHAGVAKAAEKVVKATITKITQLGRKVAAKVGLDYLGDQDPVVIPFGRVSKVEAPASVLDALEQIDQLNTPAVPDERTSAQQAIAWTLSQQEQSQEEEEERIDRYRDLCAALNSGQEPSVTDWDWLMEYEKTYGNTVRRVIAPNSFGQQKTG